VTVLDLNPTGVAQAVAALRAGDPVIIPMASPLPYALTALDGADINVAKRRPPEQPCGLLIRHFDDVAPHLDLDPTTVQVAGWIALAERANVFAPLLPSAPRWLSDSSRDGFVGITVARGWRRSCRSARSSECSRSAAPTCPPSRSA
jgi:hypothetical protein